MDVRNNSKYDYPCRYAYFSNIQGNRFFAKQIVFNFLLSTKLKEDLIKLSAVRLLKISFEDSYHVIFGLQLGRNSKN